MRSCSPPVTTKISSIPALANIETTCSITVLFFHRNNSLFWPMRIDFPAAKMMAEIITFHPKSGVDIVSVYPHPATGDYHARVNIPYGAYEGWLAHQRPLRVSSNLRKSLDQIKQGLPSDPAPSAQRLDIIPLRVFPPVLAK